MGLFMWKHDKNTTFPNEGHKCMKIPKKNILFHEYHRSHGVKWQEFWVGWVGTWWHGSWLAELGRDLHGRWQKRNSEVDSDRRAEGEADGEKPGSEMCGIGGGQHGCFGAGGSMVTCSREGVRLTGQGVWRGARWAVSGCGLQEHVQKVTIRTFLQGAELKGQFDRGGALQSIEDLPKWCQCQTAGPWRTDRACGQRPPLPNVAFWPYKKTSCLPAAKFQHEPLAASVFFSSSCLSASSRFWHSLLLACPFFSFGPLLLVSPPLTRSPCWRQGSADIPIDIITDIIYFPS